MTKETATAVRVAIIGYGLGGAVFHAPLVAATAGMVVAHIVTANPQRQAQAQRDFPHATILSAAEEVWQAPQDVDLVVITTPNRWHAPFGIAAMQAGLPVVIDKPLATSVAAGEALLATSQSTGVPLTCFQNRRWDGDFLTVRQIIADDVIGSVFRFESRFERYRPEPRAGVWRELAAPDEGGGLLFDLGSHLIDQAIQLFGMPTGVFAEIAQRRPGAQVDDDTFVALQFASGVRAHLWMSSIARLPGPRFVVRGLRGTYSKAGLDPQEDALRRSLRPGAEGWGVEPRAAWGRLATDIGSVAVDGEVETLPGAYETFYAGVRDSLRNHAPMPVDPADAVLTLRVIAAAHRSAQHGTVEQI